MRLEEGNVIEIKKGHKIRTEIPEHFVCQDQDSEGEFKKLYSELVTVGEPYNGLDTDFYQGKYVVYKTTFDGGGRSHNDIYPDEHHVWCQKVVGRYGPEIKMDFYQPKRMPTVMNDIKPCGAADIQFTIKEKPK